MRTLRPVQKEHLKATVLAGQPFHETLILLQGWNKRSVKLPCSLPQASPPRRRGVEDLTPGSPGKWLCYDKNCTYIYTKIDKCVCGKPWLLRKLADDWRSLHWQPSWVCFPCILYILKRIKEAGHGLRWLRLLLLCAASWNSQQVWPFPNQGSCHTNQSTSLMVIPSLHCFLERSVGVNCAQQKLSH